MALDPRAIHIYTDGSCYKNLGGSSGCAAIVRYPDHLGLADEEISDFGCGESTNNRMELLACIRALEWVRANAPWNGVGRIQIVTDSLYVKDNVPRAREWKKNDWRNRHGEPMEHGDLWKRLLSIKRNVGLIVDFVWMRGKATPIQRAVDKAAKAAAQRGGIDIDRGFRPGTVARSMVKGSATRFPAQGQVIVIRPYRKNVMGKGENKIRFDVFSETAQAFTASHYAYAPPTMAAELHRQNGYRVRFNDDARYPQILEILEPFCLPQARSKRRKRPIGAI